MKAARFLRHARRRAGMTQRELAQATGVAQPAIARIERGAISPGIDTLERLLAATGATLEVAPRLGIGVDRTLIRASMERSPEERILAVTRAAYGLAVWQREARRGRHA